MTAFVSSISPALYRWWCNCGAEETLDTYGAASDRAVRHSQVCGGGVARRGCDTCGNIIVSKVYDHANCRMPTQHEIDAAINDLQNWIRATSSEQPVT